MRVLNEFDHLRCGPVAGGGNADIDGDAFENSSGFQSGGGSDGEPVVDFGIVDVVESGLCPIGPQAETEADFVGIGGDCGDTGGKFVGIGCPIADGAEPAGIEVEHFQAERVRRRRSCDALAVR